MLDQEQEKDCIETLESLISGKVAAIGLKETKSLVALRKEYYRRNLEISSSNTTIINFDKVNQKLN